MFIFIVFSKNLVNNFNSYSEALVDEDLSQLHWHLFNHESR